MIAPRARRAALVLGLAASVVACVSLSPVENEAAALTGGDPRRGAVLLRGYGCSSCHVVPGVAGAVGTVGPPLSRMAARSFVAGRLANTPGNLIRWIRAPRSVDPQTAMPDLGVPEQDARDIAAYLETLR